MSIQAIYEMFRGHLIHKQLTPDFRLHKFQLHSLIGMNIKI